MVMVIRYVTMQCAPHFGEGFALICGSNPFTRMACEIGYVPKKFVWGLKIQVGGVHNA